MRALTMFDRALGVVIVASNNLGSLAIVAMTLAVVADVSGRYLLNSPINGTAEMVTMAVVVVLYLQLAYTLRSGQERVIGYLLADVADSAGNGRPVEVHLTPGKSVIASRLNMTPEHFSRILHELGNAGLIEIQGRTVRIPDLARLRAGG